LLISHPGFTRVCGFTPKEKHKTVQYRFHQVPGRRKLGQFDPVKRQAGFWDNIRVSALSTNLERTSSRKSG